MNTQPRRRACDGCSLCCKLLRVYPLDKPAGVWCEHAKKGTGCRIYAARPEVCRTFECLWLRGHGADWMRPDKLHAVMTPTTNGEGMIVHEDPGFRGQARLALREFLDAFVADGESYAVVVCGTERELIAREDKAEEMLAKVRQEEAYIQAKLAERGEV